MRLPKVAFSLLLAVFAALLATAPADAYRVRSGDTLWALSHRTGIPLPALVARNHIANPDRIYAGQELDLSAPAPPAPPPAPAPEAKRPHPAPPPDLPPAAARKLLIAAANERGVRPSFVLAVSYWESGWNQNEVSVDGAVGLMQITPGTAAWAGPALLGRRVNLNDAHDNARLGAALLRLYLDQFKDPKLALAAYYQGAAAVKQHGIYPSSRVYVDGIWSLRNRFEAST